MCTRSGATFEHKVTDDNPHPPIVDLSHVLHAGYVDGLLVFGPNGPSVERAAKNIDRRLKEPACLHILRGTVPMWLLRVYVSMAKAVPLRRRPSEGGVCV